MVNYSKILFPVDLSDTAPAVAEHVAALAEKFSAEVHAVHVVPAYEGPVFPSYQEVMNEIQDAAEQDLGIFVSGNLPKTLKVIQHIVVGHTSRRLLNYVAKHDISLVVMGTHGRSGMGKLFFGSVAQRVVQNCPVPVLTVNPVRPDA